MIVPAIIPRSLEHLRETVARLPFARSLQIDLVDGRFVPDVSWPYNGGDPEDARSLLSDREVEMDLMVERPEAAARLWLELGVARIVFHLEAILNWDEISKLKQDFEFKLGIALNNDTLLEKLYPHIEKIDYVQLMGIKEIGRQGQPFDERVVARAREMKTLYPNMEVSVDGSVNEKTLPLLSAAGVDRFVAGSALLSANAPSEEYSKLLKIALASRQEEI